MLEPIGERLIIKPKSPDEKTKGGIILAKKDEDKQDTGTVIAVAKGNWVEDDFKVGDVLVYQKYGPVEFTHEKEKYVIVHADEVLARIGGKGERS